MNDGIQNPKRVCEDYTNDGLRKQTKVQNMSFAEYNVIPAAGLSRYNNRKARYCRGGCQAQDRNEKMHKAYPNGIPEITFEPRTPESQKGRPQLPLPQTTYESMLYETNEIIKRKRIQRCAKEEIKGNLTNQPPL